MNTQRVLLYGRSLLLGAVAAGLEQPGLCVARATTWAEASRLLAEKMPDALIFDLTATYESHILPLLFKRPGLLLIGLDAECNQAVVVSGTEAKALTLGQIRRMVGAWRHGETGTPDEAG